jgi:hypothetical protein
VTETGSILGKDKKASSAAKQWQKDASAVVVALGKRSVDVYNGSTDLRTLVIAFTVVSLSLLRK